MKTTLTSSKSVDQVAGDFEEAVARHKFGVLHVYNLKETLENKGFPREEEIRVYEICNPARATEVLDVDIAMNMALPCRVSVYSENGQTKIGMINPTDMLAMLNSDERLKAVAEEVEEAINAMMQEAV
ncbi:MAG: DUF302 domain-containing protein [Bacteroidota bacterium]|nr:DUF302 domain-containing protein [Bacteroidota bacterium]